MIEVIKIYQKDMTEQNKKGFILIFMYFVILPSILEL